MRCYRFTDDETKKTFCIRFRHNSRRKNKPPKSTTCTISDEAGNILSEAIAQPTSELAIPIEDGSEAKEFEVLYGRRLRRVLPMLDGGRVAILAGDNFSYETGRRESLRKALAAFPRKGRSLAWNAYHEAIQEARERSLADLLGPPDNEH